MYIRLKAIKNFAILKSYFLKQVILLIYLLVLLSKCCKTYINKNLIMHDSIHF